MANESDNAPGEAKDAISRSALDRPIVVFAGSAGSVKPLLTVTAGLPADFAAPVVILQHRSAQFPDLLVQLIGSRAAMRVRPARDGDVPEPGNLYVSPAGLHVSIEPMLRLMEGPRLNFVQASADLLFYSTARVFGRRTVGVVFSGTGTDGALGSRAIVDAGGKVIVQSPASCAYPSMPTAAALFGPTQLVLAPDAIPAALEHLVAEAAALPRAESVTTEVPTPPRGVTTVLLVDDHDIIRDGLRVLLQRESDVMIVAEATNGRAAVEAARALKPDVVVMDVAMPEMDGIEATRQICASEPATKIIVLSAQTDLGSIGRAFAAGAVGFIGKQKAFEELLSAVRTIVSTGEYVGHDLR